MTTGCQTSLGYASLLVFGAFVVTWLAGRRLRNFGIVDAVWSFAFGPVAAIYAALGEGWNDRRWALTVFVILWSSRLGWHLARRLASMHPEEDVRYAELREEWGSAADLRMLGFYVVQAALVLVLSVPFLISMNDPLGGFRANELAAAVLGLTAILGETIADAQLARAKRAGDIVCRRGLWAWSRHPNYFFEWLVWVAFALFASAGPLGWLAWLSPVLMLHFLVNVTGIPMTEELAVRRKGDAYREYQRTTSAFVPWFRKET